MHICKYLVRSFVIKPTLWISTVEYYLLHSYMFLPSWDFYIYSIWSVFINVQLEKKETLLVIGTAWNIKPTWASHIPTEDPEKARPTVQPPAPAQPGSPMVPASVNQCPSASVGSAGHASPWHLHRKCPSPACRERSSLREGGREECVCQVRKRGMKEMCSSTKGTCQWPPTAIPWAWWASGILFWQSQQGLSGPRLSSHQV